MADQRKPADIWTKMREAASQNREARAKERSKRGLGAVGDGEPGVEIELFDTAAYANAKAGQEWKILNAMPLGASRLGWLPDLPLHIPWPVVEGKKLPFLAEINLAELPTSNHSLLPAVGSLYVFARGDSKHLRHAISIFFDSTPAEQLVRAERPDHDELWPDWKGECLYDGVPLTLKRRAAIESDGRWGLSPSAWLFHTSNEFGTAGQIADEAFLEGTDWINLMTIRSVGGMQWSDCGELYINVRRTDLISADFTRVLAVIRSG